MPVAGVVIPFHRQRGEGQGMDWPSGIAVAIAVLEAVREESG